MVKEQIEEMWDIITTDCDNNCGGCKFENDTWCFTHYVAEHLYNAGYRKQNDEELIDKIATYFEKEDNWTKLKYAWNISGKSVQLRDMLRGAICGAKMKGGAE